MDIKSTCNNQEDDAADTFGVAVEISKFGHSEKEVKRLVITRGSHSESLRINSQEAQHVMITLAGAFPGLFSNLIKAAEPLSELLEDDYKPGTMMNLEVDAGDVTALRDALYTIKLMTPNEPEKD